MRVVTLSGAALAMLAALVLASPRAVSAEVTLRAGIFIGSKKFVIRQAFDKFVDKVNAEGRGLVKIGPVVSSEAVPSRQMPNALKSGVLDMIVVPPSYMDSLVPVMEGFNAAKIMPAEQRKNGAWDLINGLAEKNANAHLLAQYGNGVRFHIYTNKPVRTIDDLKGMRLGTSNTYRAFLAALHAQPIQVPVSEMYTAMDRGVLDGFVNVDSTVQALGWSEVVKYRIDPGFYDALIFVAINDAKWKSMSSAQRAFLNKMGLYLENDINTSLANEDVAIGQKLAKAGKFKIVALPDAQAKRYSELAYKALWDGVEQRMPELGRKLRHLLAP